MHSKTKWMLGALLLLLQTALQAQADTAQKLLDRLTHWKTADTYQIDFMYGHEEPGKQAELQRGTLYVKGDRYHVSMGALEVYGDKRSETTYEKSGKITVLQANETAEVLPQQVLRLRFLPQTTLPADGYDAERGNFRLLPVKPKAYFTVINIHLHQKTEKIQAIRLEQAGGDKYHYFVLDVKTGIELSDELFRH